ncbi:MAG: methionine--tRNA ligase [Phycisphaerales bacterium]
MPPVYVTTPIYYVNDRPHIGHAYTTTVCDVYARFMRAMGNEVFFLTGTDEHGAKVEKSAAERGLDPQSWADRNAAEFQRVLTLFGLSNDDFIRTSEPRHVRQVQRFVAELRRRDAIYLGKFEGWYDEGQEEYHTETKAKELGYRSPVGGRALVRATESNYFLRLSAFQEPIERLFRERPDFVRPEARRNEVLGRLRDGLQDVPISRTNFTWGIPMPGDEQHVIYVWIDALFNYITALELGEEHPAHPQRARFWPATYHVIGKEILWFHAVVWPAMLMALDLPLPGCVYAHSFWIANGQKMSKSLGNFIDLETIQGFHATYGLDAWRYFMATRGPLDATDSDFSAAAFHETYTTDLVNTVGNCASRVTAMIGRYFDGALPPDALDSAGRPIPIADHDWAALGADATARSIAAMEELDLSGSIGAAVALVRRVDGFINQTEPFRIAKDPARRAELGAILHRCAEAVRIAALLLEPTMPTRMGELLAALRAPHRAPRAPLAEVARWGGLEAGTAVTKVALFPRVERA